MMMMMVIKMMKENAKGLWTFFRLLYNVGTMVFSSVSIEIVLIISNYQSTDARMILKCFVFVQKYWHNQSFQHLIDKEDNIIRGGR